MDFLQLVVSKYGKVKDLFSSDDNIEDAVGEEETYVEGDAV
jgi:Mg2+/Co2+ transporter CorB